MVNNHESNNFTTVSRAFERVRHENIASVMGLKVIQQLELLDSRIVPAGLVDRIRGRDWAIDGILIPREQAVFTRDPHQIIFTAQDSARHTSTMSAHWGVRGDGDSRLGSAVYLRLGSSLRSQAATERTQMIYTTNPKLGAEQRIEISHVKQVDYIEPAMRTEQLIRNGEVVISSSAGSGIDSDKLPLQGVRGFARLAFGMMQRLEVLERYVALCKVDNDRPLTHKERNLVALDVPTWVSREMFPTVPDDFYFEDAAHSQQMLVLDQRGSRSS